MMSGKTEKDNNSYRSIFKGVSVFGGVQVFHILVSLIRGKLVAMLLGPVGMGINSLYVTSTDMVRRFSGLGLNLAIVKEAAAAREDAARIERVVAVARRLTLLAAALGCVVCMLLSGVLSVASFGDSAHVWAFVALGAAVMFSVAGEGEMSLLQGVHDVKRLSAATVFGSLCGLLISVPLYWFMGVRGIVPALVALSFAVYAFYFVATRRRFGRVAHGFSWHRDWPLVRQLLLLGLVLMSGSLIGSVCTYLLQAYVRYTGGLADAGLYQGVNSMTLQYSAVVFSALAMDYLPRLSAAAGDDAEMCRVVNRQTEIVCCLILPLAGAMILLAPCVVHILLTREFYGAVPLLRWMSLALLLKGLMYPLGYITFAKDNKRLYFWMEGVGGNLLTLALMASFYTVFGLDGLGMAMVVDDIIAIVVYLIVNGRLYGFRLSGTALTHVLLSVVAGSALFAVCMLCGGWQGALASSLIFAAAASFAGFRLFRLLRRG